MKTTTETVEMLVRVKVKYDTPKAKRNAIAAIRHHLHVGFSSFGVHGYFSVQSGRVKLAPTEKAP